MTVFNRIDVPDIGRARTLRPAGRMFNRPDGAGFDVRAQDGATVIDLYDEIGFFGITAAEFRRKLDAVRTDEILVRINSPGGDVFDGIAIHNDLAAHPARVTTRVTGIAASAASEVAMAGDRIEMFESAFLMIHNAWALVIGDRNDLRGFADVLEQIDGALAAVYARRTGKTAKAISALMDAETWMAGPKAVEEGFADALVEPAGEDGTVVAWLDFLSRFRNAPEPIRAPAVAPPSEPEEMFVIPPDARAAFERLYEAMIV